MVDENFRTEIIQYIKENRYVLNICSNICSWVKENYEVDISKSSMSNWLHDLGFSYQQFTKGVYFDGHEREDVVKDRESYLKELESMEKRSWVYNSPCPDPSLRPVIRVYHDESTYYANADQPFFWNDGTKHVLNQKSLGQAIIVSGGGRWYA